MDGKFRLHLSHHQHMPIPHPEVCRLLTTAGLGMDVSSGCELQLVLGQGASKIVFSGPGKTEAELRLALTQPEKVMVLADSFSELKKLSSLAAQQNIVARVGVRLTTEADPLWRKFGIAAAELPEFWQTAHQLPGIDFCGLQFHTSWNMNPDAQVSFIRKLGQTLRQIPRELLKQLKFIDIGGGIWPPAGEWLQHAATPVGVVEAALGMLRPDRWRLHYRQPAAPLAVFAEAISAAINEHVRPYSDCRIWFEPGRWISHDAMQLIMAVADKKTDDLVITDAGTNAVGWERFEHDYFPVINLSRPQAVERPCRILGSLCTPHDVWGYSYWGSSIEAGDVLLIPSQGAYSFSLRQNFIKPVPEVVVI
ncbi:MAG: alanine racemase [Bacillota bacterium]